MRLRNLTADKFEFYQQFEQFMRRDVLLLNDSSDFKVLDAWCKSQGRFVIKPRYGTGGYGVEIMEYDPIPGVTLVYLKELTELGKYVLEELIRQHLETTRFNPRSVNSIRVMTIEKQGIVEFIGPMFRMGNGGVMDNFHSGGMVAPVDLETGKISAGAITMDFIDGKVITIHPLTGVEIVGHQLPYWPELVEFIKQLCREIEGHKSIGWDIAISPEGPVLIEANSMPNTSAMQFLANKGMLEELLPYIDHRYLFPAQRRRYGL